MPRPPVRSVLSQQRVHRHVLERVAASLTVPQQACARRASKALWEAVRAASMEDMLRATVVEHQDVGTVDPQLVVVAMSRVVGSFPSMDALLAWSGGLTLLYEDLQLRFPNAAAIGISARLTAIRPFPFASGFTVMTVCVVTAAALARPTLVVESVVLGVRNATTVLVRALSIDGSPCPILCLEGATSEQLPNMVHDVLLSSLPSIGRVENCTFEHCASLQFVCLENLPLLGSIGAFAFGACVRPGCRFSGFLVPSALLEIFCTRLSSLSLADLPSLRIIERCAFSHCVYLQSIRLENLPLLEIIGNNAFAECVLLSSFCFSALPSLRRIGGCAFWKCASLRSICLTNLPLLDSIDGGAFALCARLSSLDLSGLPSLCLIKEYAFAKCESLESISLVNLPLLESIGYYAFAECVRLSSVVLSGLPSLRTIGDSAFTKCWSLQSIFCFVNLPALEHIGNSAFAGCVHLSSFDVSQLCRVCEKVKRAKRRYTSIPLAT